MEIQHKRDTITSLVLGVYVVSFVSIFLWMSHVLPPGVINYFVAIWMAAMSIIPIVYASKFPLGFRVGFLLFWVPFALFVQFSMLHYHLFSIGFVLFAMAWLIGWQIQEKKSPWKKRLPGTIIGGIFVIVGLLIFIAQIQEVRKIWHFKHLNPASVQRIEFQRESDQTLYIIDDKATLSQIVHAFGASYPYSGRGATFGSDPWNVRLIFVPPTQSHLTFRIGKGIPINPETIWLTFEEEARDHDYQNVVLYDILTQKISPSLW